MELFEAVVLSSVRVKAEVVSADEREGGLRNLLNFGHSIGHAIEAVLAPDMLHGECVAIGMVKEAQIARNAGILSIYAYGRLVNCLSDYQLPVDLDDPRIQALRHKTSKLSVNVLLSYMDVDKKNIGTSKRIVLLSKIGGTHEKKASQVSTTQLVKVLSRDVALGPFPGSVDHVVRIMPPGSKSISNRALLLAAICEGECVLQNLLHSDDTKVMLRSLHDMDAASFTWGQDGSITVHGNGKLRNPGHAVYLGNAGTASRFLTAFSNLAVGSSDRLILTGNKRMQERPIGPLVEALRSNGCDIRYLQSDGCLPLSIGYAGGITGGEICLSAKISSQYVSAILMCAPLAKNPVTLRLVGGTPVSQPYIDMTIEIMRTFGIVVELSPSEPFTYHIPCGKYRSPGIYRIESDASSATYPLAVAAITGTTCVVDNVGLGSLQGDASFAAKVLKEMGCEVIQSQTSTTVTGPRPGCLKALNVIDMVTMTDAFLTAAVLASVATTNGGKTEIIGIANQRVKECNRIQAMITELSKFGVHTKELPDGLIVYGSEKSHIKVPVDGIFCYDDHRIAMAFSVLSCFLSSPVVILDKKCTEKTWPDWWDVLDRKFKVPCNGVNPSTELPRIPVYICSPTVVIIGLRGAGKTSMGQMASKGLAMKFIDLDIHLEQRIGRRIADIVKQDGWSAFRALELQMLEEVLRNEDSGSIIATGGGIVETPAARRLLQDFHQHGLVVYLHRDPDDIERFLNLDTSRPSWEEPIADVIARRIPLYRHCSTHQFVNESFETTSISFENAAGFTRFLKDILETPAAQSSLALKDHSYSASVKLGGLKSLLDSHEIGLNGVDLVELLADIDDLDDPSSSTLADDILKQITALNHLSSLPILLTLKHQNLSASSIQTSLLDHILTSALQWGIDYLALDLTWEDALLKKISSRKRSTKILATYDDTLGRLSWDDDTWLLLAENASSFADIIRFTSIARNFSDNYRLESFRDKYSKQYGKRICLLNKGPAGILSLLTNQIITPVGEHSPSKLGVSDLNKLRTRLGAVEAANFYLIGSPISHSKSPMLHNSLFHALGLPHKYHLHESPEIGTAIKIFDSFQFGGASVTIPHKINVMRYLHEISEEATIIGAVNTVIAEKADDKVILKGHNTDWIGMIKTINYFSRRTTYQGAGLVIGAGGTARAAIYALHRMNISPIYLCNRNPENIEKLRISLPASFDIRPAARNGNSSTHNNITVAISTVPANVHLDPSLLNLIQEWLIADSGVSDTRRWFLEMAYEPRRTQLMELAEKYNWHSIPGLEVLVQQGIEQSRLWTGFQSSVAIGRRAII